MKNEGTEREEGAVDTKEKWKIRDRICKRLRSPGINSKEAIPPAYVAWRAGTTNRIIVRGPPRYRLAELIPGLLKRLWPHRLAESIPSNWFLGSFTNSGSG